MKNLGQRFFCKSDPSSRKANDDKLGGVAVQPIAAAAQISLNFLPFSFTSPHSCYQDLIQLEFKNKTLMSSLWIKTKTEQTGIESAI